MYFNFHFKSNPIQQRSLQAAQINMESFFCAMKMKLKKSWSQLANTISAFRGSLEWSAQGNPEYSICAGHLQYVLNAIMFFEILFQIYPTILSGTPYLKFHAEASDMPPPAAAASFLFHY